MRAAMRAAASTGSADTSSGDGRLVIEGSEARTLDATGAGTLGSAEGIATEDDEARAAAAEALRGASPSRARRRVEDDPDDGGGGTERFGRAAGVAGSVGAEAFAREVPRDDSRESGAGGATDLDFADPPCGAARSPALASLLALTARFYAISAAESACPKR
jgi:hypothetical protein